MQTEQEVLKYIYWNIGTEIDVLIIHYKTNDFIRFTTLHHKHKSIGTITQLITTQTYQKKTKPKLLLTISPSSMSRKMSKRKEEKKVTTTHQPL